MLGARLFIAIIVLAAGSFSFGWKFGPEKILTTPTRSTNATTTEQLFSVSRVVDGDTIVVAIDGVDTKVRLLGINTPETVDPRKTVECFGKQASQKTKSLLEGRNVRLVADSSQGDKDKYGRLLRYVWRDDGIFVNKELIQEGYAYEYTYHTPYLYQQEFKTAQREAEQNKLGLWATDACVK